MSHLSKILKQPKNRLINEAVKLYVQQRSQEEERKLEATLSALRSYRRRDPDFKKVIDVFVNAEAQLSIDDPMEA